LTNSLSVRPSVCLSVKILSSPDFFYVLWYIDLIFGLWLYLDKLRFKFEFCSGRMIFVKLYTLQMSFHIQTATFEILRYLFSAYHFPVLVQITTFEILRYLCNVIKHFPVLFQKQIHFRHIIYFLQVLYFIYFYNKMYQYYIML
jgi:hypothetical protein